MSAPPSPPTPSLTKPSLLITLITLMFFISTIGFIVYLIPFIQMTISASKECTSDDLCWGIFLLVADALLLRLAIFGFGILLSAIFGLFLKYFRDLINSPRVAHLFQAVPTNDPTQNNPKVKIDPPKSVPLSQSVAFSLKNLRKRFEKT